MITVKSKKVATSIKCNASPFIIFVHEQVRSSCRNGKRDFRDSFGNRLIYKTKNRLNEIITS